MGVAGVGSCGVGGCRGVGYWGLGGLWRVVLV